MTSTQKQRVAIGFAVLIVAMVALGLHFGNRPSPEPVVPAAPADPASPAPAIETMPVTIYLYDARRDMDASGNVLCSAQGLVPSTRTVPQTEARLAAALGELFAGSLTEEERGRGLRTEFPLEGVRLSEVEVDNGTAVITVRDPDHKSSGGACRVNIMRAQIERTAREFSTVERVRFAPEGVFEP
ncbi:MAG TPA: GerMN domain-containing protein [Candidatus Paceibacterota bacterium]|jgi:spore germination protein GerM